MLSTHSYKLIACTLFAVTVVFCALWLFNSCCEPLTFIFRITKMSWKNRSGILGSPGILGQWQSGKPETVFLIYLACRNFDALSLDVINARLFGLLLSTSNKVH